MGTLRAGGTLRLDQIGWEAMGVWAGSGLPLTVSTLDQWRSSRRGFWAYLDPVKGIIPFTPTEVARETVSLAETVTSRWAQREALGESLSLADAGIDYLTPYSYQNATEALVEAVIVGDLTASRWAQFEALADALSSSESGSDAYAAVDPFVAFQNSLPKPLQPGKYPVANASGSYDYMTAQQILQTIESSTPKAEFSISMAGV